jgi:hypothetical protein
VKYVEPSLDSMEDYRGEESLEKRLVIWVVILSGLLIGAIYSIIKLNNTLPAEVIYKQEVSGILKQ